MSESKHEPMDGRPDVCDIDIYALSFMETRFEVEQVMDLRNTLRYLGIPVMTPSMMFGDNASVVGSVNIPSSCIKKRHVILSFHKVREAVASGSLYYGFLRGKDNVADILSKLWSYQCVWKRLQALLFWNGNTLELIKKELDSVDENHDKSNGMGSKSNVDHVICGVNTFQK